MQESTIFSPLPQSSNTPNTTQTEHSGFPSSFDGALNWNLSLPEITLNYNIETIYKEYDAFSKLMAVANSIQNQIESLFPNNTNGLRTEIESRIDLEIDSCTLTEFECTLEKKSAIVKLLQRANMSTCWHEAVRYFGVDPLSLDSEEMAATFAAFIDTSENEEERSGYYEGLLRSLTAAYHKRTLVEGIAFLEDITLTVDAAIQSALIRGKTAHSFNFTLDQSAELVTVAGAATLLNTDGWTFGASTRKNTLLLMSLGQALFSRAAAIGIGALLYSPALGNGELYPQTVLKLPGNAVLPSGPLNLNEIATARGTVDLPFRIQGNINQYTVVATPAGGSISPAVPVRELEFNKKTNSFTFTSADTPPITLSFPIIHWEKSSTISPARPAEIPRYAGVELLPLFENPVTLPAIELPDFKDCIYCFPINSGHPPIYVVFNSPYEGATTRGEFSGRLFDPTKAGGPILDLDWKGATVTQSGIDLVKLHTGRFGPSDANTVMIARLEKILRGTLTITDIDKRFYTHELRELDRFRALAVPDTVNPKDGGATWNNIHAATLEDFKIKDDHELLYTPEAIEADNKQTEREWQNI